MLERDCSQSFLHQFGDHSHCRTWCAISKNPTKKHKNLPLGEDLVNNDLNIKAITFGRFYKT